MNSGTAGPLAHSSRAFAFGAFSLRRMAAALGEKGCRVALIDAVRGEILAVHPRTLSARAAFSRLDGLSRRMEARRSCEKGRGS